MMPTKSNQFLIWIHKKDLSYLNRDLSKVIVIDWDESAYQLQPRNALHRLKKWDGNETDSELVYLASFLKSKDCWFVFMNKLFLFGFDFEVISASGVNDVRDVLDFYNKEIDPMETFKLKQVQLAVLRWIIWIIF